MKCKACEIQDQPKDFLSPARCAFDNVEGVAIEDNWQCATLCEIRALIGESSFEHYNERTNSVFLWENDQRSILIAMGDGRFLILGWYKSRGTTEFIGVLDGVEMRPLHCDDAEKLLEKLNTKE